MLGEQKEERVQCLRALSSSLYKYTTFSAEIQIALTFRNTATNVKKTRFAQTRGWQVLYYEGRGRPLYVLVSTEACGCLLDGLENGFCGTFLGNNKRRNPLYP